MPWLGVENQTAKSHKKWGLNQLSVSFKFHVGINGGLRDAHKMSVGIPLGKYDDSSISNEILELVFMAWVFHLGLILIPISLGLIPISGY